MNTHELLEAAQLDALGLLDESERDSFEKAFAGAHPSIKAQIRLEQARLCRLEGVWPDIRPQASLKDRVIEAVRAARGVKAAEAADARPHIAGRLVPPISNTRRVSPLWRAAALGFATAAAVCAAMVISLRAETDKLQASVNGSTIYGLGDTVGHANLNDIIFNANTKRIVFNAASSRMAGKMAAGEAVVFFNPDRASMRLVANNVALNDGESLRLCVIDGDGKIVQEVQEFKTAGTMVAEDVNVNGRDLASKGLRLALYAATRGRDAASGVALMTSGSFNA